MKELVYIETTVFSFYHDVRPGATIRAMHDWTRGWWDTARKNYQIVTSTAVLAELEKGKLPHRKKALELALTIPVVPLEDGVSEIVSAYIRLQLMPQDPIGDAMHLALASWHKCDYLLTWNCKHLANANKFAHVRRVNAMLGLHIPTLTTPLELTGAR